MPPPADIHAPAHSPHRVLIVLLSGSWLGIARLPRALAAAGLHVATLSPENSYLAKTRFVDYHFALPANGNPLPALVGAIRHYRPELLIPGCESAVRFLHELSQAGGANEQFAASVGDVLALVRRSLGKDIIPPAPLSKHVTHELATRLGLRTPRQTLVGSLDQALAASEKLGFPLILKGEFGFAGNAVRICRTQQELASAWQFVAKPGVDRRIAVQQYIHGKVAMHVGLAIEGHMLKSFAALALHTHPLATSPCSVARLISNRESEHALATLVRAYGFSGFCSIDCILENDTRTSWLLEFNPRPVPLTSLGGIFGHDLCRSLRCHLDGSGDSEAHPPARHETISLFPNEWLRDASSPWLTQAWHDVPWDDPGLLKALVDSTLAPRPTADKAATPVVADD